MSWLDDLLTAPMRVMDNGVLLPVERTLNFEGGAVDNPGQGRTDIPASGGSSGILSGLYSTRPAAGTVDRIFVCTDPGIVQFFDDGTAWRPLVDQIGRIGTESAPGGSVAGYTFTNDASSCTLAQSCGVASIVGLGSSSSPSNKFGLAGVALAPGKKVETCLKGGTVGNLSGTNLSGAVTAYGVYIRQTSGDVRHVFQCFPGNSSVGTQFEVQVFTGATFGSTLYGPEVTEFGNTTPTWMRIRDDGTNFNYEISLDGTFWHTLFQEADSASFNEAGFHAYPYGGSVRVDALSLIVG